MKQIWLVVVFLLLVMQKAVWAEDWAPIKPEELALKASTVEPGADAEAFFWEVKVKDDLEGNDGHTVYENYIRIKIFTDRGRETHGTVELAYSDRSKIKDIEARTIKPDGTILLLKKDAVFERSVAKARGLHLKAKSFALPGVEPGCIIEYRWRDERPLESYKRIQCQRSFPIQKVVYYIAALKLDEYGMNFQGFHFFASPPEKTKGGLYKTEMTKVQAFKEEPRMPPEDQVRSWILLYYSNTQRLSPAEYWKKTGKTAYEKAKWLTRQNDDIREKAQSLTSGAATPDEKIKRLFDFCRAEIKNSSDDASFTPDERAKLKENESPSDTLKRKIGTGRDICILFGSLVRAAGFDARWALLPDRGDMFFDPQFPDDYFLTSYDICVKVGDQWRFFDPGSSYVEYGMLRWQEEGVQALITDPKEPFFITTPVSAAARTLKKRTANLKLGEDGTIEGDVTMEYTGHSGNELKEDHDEESPTEREQSIKDLMKGRMSSGEVTNARIENANSSDKPLTYLFHIKVPGYGQKTGKRVFFQPNFFQKGIDVVFTSTDRRYPVYFQYPWSESDTVKIELPEGYELETPETPPPLSAGDAGQYNVKMSLKDKILSAERSFTFNGVFFEVAQYPPLKQLFDALYERDNRTLTLKQVPAAAPAGPTSSQ